jgi:hypothetical protein
VKIFVKTSSSDLKLICLPNDIILSSQLIGRYDIVANCTGLGSQDLVGDQLLVPNRGHLVKVGLCTSPFKLPLKCIICQWEHQISKTKWQKPLQHQEPLLV